MVFVTSQCLRAELASKDTQLKVCACKKLFWYVGHCSGNDCSERKLRGTSVVCRACGTSARAVPHCKSCSECPQQGPQPERDSNGKYFSEKTRIGLYGYEEERRRRKTWLTWKTPSAGFLLSCRETNVAASWEGEMGRVTSRHGCHWLCYGKARQPL